MKPNPLLTLALGIVISASGCLSPHGGPVPLYWLSAIGPKSDGSYAPRIEGSDGSSPDTALTIHEFDKGYLLGHELEWVHERHWWPLMPGGPDTEISESWTEEEYQSWREKMSQSWRDFRSNVTHETKRIGTSVYDVVILRLPNGESRTNYFDVTRQRFYWPRER